MGEYWKKNWSEPGCFSGKGVIIIKPRKIANGARSLAPNGDAGGEGGLIGYIVCVSSLIVMFSKPPSRAPQVAQIWSLMPLIEPVQR